jgi:hypothetical protein
VVGCERFLLEVSVTDDERIVREAWKEEFIYISYGAVFLCIGQCGVSLPSIRAAAEFTIQRQEDIRQVKGEVDCQFVDTDTLYRRLLEFIRLGEVKHLVGCTIDLCVSSRILAARQATLAELQRGMKETE